MSAIHHINLAGLDLNLLVVFDALMTEQNVTRAGERVGLSQPATSNALARLRTLMADELFVRTAAELRPIPRAIALAQQLRPALQHIQSALLEEAPQGIRPNTVQINQIGAFPGAESLISLFKLLKLFSRVNLTERY